MYQCKKYCETDDFTKSHSYFPKLHLIFHINRGNPKIYREPKTNKNTLKQYPEQEYEIRDNIIPEVMFVMPTKSGMSIAGPKLKN